MQLYINDLGFNAIAIVGKINKKYFAIEILILLDLIFYSYNK